MIRLAIAITLSSIFFLLPALENAGAQTLEPEVIQTPLNVSVLQDEYRTGFGFNIVMNNFGFGAGTEFRTVVAPQTELTASLRITALRDPSEQTFTDFFFGQQIVPNKFNRAFAFPLMLGIRQRLFASTIQEDYRLFLSASIGPAAAFTFPYFDDPENFGYRFTGNELILIGEELFRLQPTQVNDIFTGWSSGEWLFGGAGEFKIGLDIGSNFARLNSVEFGYYFYYFPDAVQLMMPNQPVFRTDIPRNNVVQTTPEGDILFEPFFEPQSFFGTPQITFTFGWFW
ncbi:MAG: hypothetical protein EA391_09700 [Balneolaceae bacterium]|nr:MAG: hypothetical protein EA391_09700 [Balneolaceae bacterium]